MSKPCKTLPRPLGEVIDSMTKRNKPLAISPQWNEEYVRETLDYAKNCLSEGDELNYVKALSLLPQKVADELTR